MPPVAYNLTHMLSRRLRLLTVRVQVFSSQDVRGRVAHQLLAFAREYGQPVEGGAHGHHGQDATVIPFRLTQIDLASRSAPRVCASTRYSASGSGGA
jgi:CRP-like cAMP-binding protein